MVKQNTDSLWIDEDPLWYKDAIIYELHVRAFSDSDGDGVGDFAGLIDKLDYLQDLGVTAVWLLPFYPSPLKDDGYDISDYTNILPVYGRLPDFRLFVDEAHKRGIKVITELVLNHTSDQHPWFQRARQARAQSRWRDFYVWSDSPEKYRDARIIFKDFETSNWDWDPTAKAYYWHRFYSHQPDLNYDSPLVQRAILRIVDFWLRMGVDGLRVDAVPYLFEREGTNCENLAETHQFLKRFRKFIDSRFKARMCLAEANQWPEEAVSYFGEGDEANMAFHFPLMPRMFMAIRLEDRFPIIDIIQQTPDIPPNCQWALFIRNHDELTLEMVTDEERDYMYRVYAHDPVARLNLGIRRRLAPLLNSDRKKIELMKCLLFSLPGTPVIYYGDEIGMGDNFYLGDRNGVRTPMQWSPDRNAGFSRTNPQRLYLPPIIDPEHHYEAINVENQQNNPDSLLWWTKRILALRKRYKAFGRGTLEFLFPENRKILAFFRKYENETVLVVANLSRAAQQTHLDLSQFAGRVPVDIFGRARFAQITSERYSLTLGPYAFFWFSLEQEQVTTIRAEPRPLEAVLETRAVTIRGDDIFDKENRAFLQGILADYIRDRRWFRGKARVIQSTEIVDVVPLNFDTTIASLVLLRVDYTEEEPEVYLLPLILAPAESRAEIAAEGSDAIIARVRKRLRTGDREMVLYDALIDKSFCTSLLESIGRRRRFRGENGRALALPSRAFKKLRGPEEHLEPSTVKAEQTNTSIIYGDRLILKIYRRLENGLNPDLEIGRFLTQRTPFPNIAPVAGSLEYRRGPELLSLGILQGFIPNEGDAWQYTIDFLGRYFEYALTHPTVQVPPVPLKPLLPLSHEIPQLALETIGPYLDSANLLGQRTAELHTALASIPDDPDFAPELFSYMYQNSVYHALRSFTTQNLQLLRQQTRHLPSEIQEKAAKAVELQDVILDRFRLLRRHKIRAQRIRCHGDYHLGQILFTGKDFVIIDFEGEPARPLSERRLKRSPLRDVAGMIRSFEYATHTVLLHQAALPVRPEDLPALEQWGKFWYHWVSTAFLSSYCEYIRKADLIPEDPEDLKTLLDAFLLEKVIYEIRYELNNRPDWLTVPLEGLLELLEAGQ
ncbi:MAG: maltose alpha-D-glucosyltransferase [Dehalococcoidia bacterium]|nr:maltose alpha-D-glucosyltransferase [Dehalococcoidia bacterium]